MVIYFSRSKYKMVEPSSAPTSAAPVGGRRVRATRKKLRSLKKYAKKLGGDAEEVEEKVDQAMEELPTASEVEAEGAGRRRRRRRGTRKTRKHRKSRKSLFGLKF